MLKTPIQWSFHLKEGILLNDFLKLIKKISIEAIEDKNPVNITTGEVISLSPLKVRVEQKLTLTEKMLIVPKSLTDYETVAEFSGEYMNLKLLNALKTGEKVLLLRMQGGQKFLILDKIKEEI